MSETKRKPTPKQVFNMVKSLCLKSRLADARKLILQSIGIPKEKQEQLSQNKLPDNIRTNEQHPLIKDMLRLEDAFSELHETFSDETKTENAYDTAEKLKNILPLLDNKEQAYTHYWINNCIEAYNPEEHELRAQHLQKMVELTPKNANDSILYSATLNLHHLKIPAETRYETINEAFRKTTKNSVYTHTYLSILEDLSPKYYWEISRKLSSPRVSYEQKNKYGQRAFELIDKFRLPDLKKYSYKIKLLDIMEGIQRQEKDLTLAHDTAKRKQSLIYRSARLRKRTLGIYQSFDAYR